MIKILLAHAAQQLLLVYQYDFKTAFLNSLIDEEERYQDAKAAGDNMDDPKIYTVKPERNSNG